MIIVLSGADFSSNNIGVVDIDVEIQQETTAILGRYTKTVTSDVERALNAFVYNIKKHGIYNKIKMLVLPWLGNDVSEAGYNALTGSNAFSASIANSLVVYNNGLKPVPNAAIARFNLASLGLTANNFHIAYYSNDDEVEAEGMTNNPVSRIGASTAVADVQLLYANIKMKNTYPKVAFYDANRAIGTIVSPNAYTTSVKSFLCFSAEASSQRLIINDDDVLSGTYSMANGALNTANFGLYAGETYQTTSTFDVCNGSYGLVSFGTALSETEMSAYSASVRTLMSAILGD